MTQKFCGAKPPRRCLLKEETRPQRIPIARGESFWGPPPFFEVPENLGRKVALETPKNLRKYPWGPRVTVKCSPKGPRAPPLGKKTKFWVSRVFPIEEDLGNSGEFPFF